MSMEKEIDKLSDIADDIFEWASRGDQGGQFYPSDARSFVRKLRALVSELHDAHENLLLEWKEDMERHD